MPHARRVSFHLAWILVVVLVLWGGMVACDRVKSAFDCPSGKRSVDSRAYPAQREEQCGWTNEATDTFDHMLKYYSVALPPTATGVRFFNSINFNGPDELFLRFSGAQADVDQVLGSLHALPEGRGVADEVYGVSSLLDEYNLDDWKFTGPASDYVTYDFGGQASAPGAPAGWVIVDQSAPVRTAFVYSAV